MYDAVVMEAGAPRGGYPPADVSLMANHGEVNVAVFVHGPQHYFVNVPHVESMLPEREMHVAMIRKAGWGVVEVG